MRRASERTGSRIEWSTMRTRGTEDESNNLTQGRTENAGRNESKEPMDGRRMSSEFSKRKGKHWRTRHCREDRKSEGKPLEPRAEGTAQGESVEVFGGRKPRGTRELPGIGGSGITEADGRMDGRTDGRRNGKPGTLGDDNMQKADSKQTEVLEKGPVERVANGNQVNQVRGPKTVRIERWLLRVF